MSTRTGVVCGSAALAASVVTLFVAGISAVSTAAALVGVVLLAGGQLIQSGRLVDLASALLFLALLVAALQGATTTTVLVAGGATVLAWTFAHGALDLYADLGTAPGTPVELTHVAGTTGLVGGSVVVTTLLFQLDVPPLSPLALASVVLGAIALTAALRR
ncbi:MULTISPECIES: DUF7519 family protein [Haloarcula]|jgi:hypothetical protein|uniref:Uncharacterized protein n=2 Tax=Haloarcula marismortui TaxID=2238 RepID=M0K0Q8_9EURY|nr:MULTISPECIES: hypothetical protein [Haloarcula]EMA14791.1 hypothetical protein C436_06151 [Haloarcula sinaiiensis ATCC 33800]EMA16843.1 hypothetical protein C435_13420 [Haloarcula californiae ATCC 33799]NHN64793.1 hypothetical protein [Haloarcula sp. JP-Z28]QUJ71802.1 hypothetical protein KDQ40_14085 [Haloarcula sinaiiensis ATCC 33800]